MYSSSSSDHDESSTQLNSFRDLVISLDTDFLPLLYCVQLPSSAANYHPSTGFSARSTTLFRDPSTTAVTSTEDALAEYLNRRSTVRNHFISVFDDEEHSKHRVLACWKVHDHAGCIIIEIGPTEMDDACILETNKLINFLDLYIPAHMNVDEECHLLHKSPAEAIQAGQDVSVEDWDSD